MDIQKLISKYGSQQALAQAFGVSKGAVSQWVKAGKVPEKYALRELASDVVEDLESGEQNRSTLRLIRKIKNGLRQAAE